ncbi:MAG: Rrf2 family transcriptional regulator [Bdellovibrionales bacterium]|nr:Rrf2 family transcriptional regulator [Bdellovibrionales bacterium]
MTISALDEYSIRFCLRLAACGKSHLAAAEIAEAEGVSIDYARKVLNLMTRTRILEPVRGQKGGYRLSSPPQSINLADILRAVHPEKGELCNYCEKFKGHETDCVLHAECSLRPVWQAVSDTVTSLLETVTLADLMKNERALGRVLIQQRKA